MAFLLFRKERQDGKTYYSDIGQAYKLAGYNLIYHLWKKRGCPVDQGWSITADELLRQHNPTFTGEAHSLVIDFDPNSKSRIGLMEIERIHLYTYGESDTASWSILMLELRDVFYEEDDKLASLETKRAFLARFEVKQERNKVVEFLYLRDNWCFGQNGTTNAGFIHHEARKYFLPFFSAN